MDCLLTYLSSCFFWIFAISLNKDIDSTQFRGWHIFLRLYEMRDRFLEADFCLFICDFTSRFCIIAYFDLFSPLCWFYCLRQNTGDRRHFKSKWNDWWGFFTKISRAEQLRNKQWIFAFRFNHLVFIYLLFILSVHPFFLGVMDNNCFWEHEF